MAQKTTAVKKEDMAYTSPSTAENQKNQKMHKLPIDAPIISI